MKEAFRVMEIKYVDSLIGKPITGIYMIRFLLPSGEPIYKDDPIIIRIKNNSLCLRGKSECLVLDNQWTDPFSLGYIMENPIYSEEILKMRSEIGGNYIIDVSSDSKFNIYKNKSIYNYNFIKNSTNQIVGIVFNLDQIFLTSIVMGEECVINPSHLPEDFRIVN